MRTPYALTHHSADLVTTAEACVILGGLDRSTISRWVQIGKLKADRKIHMGRNGAFLFDRAVVEALAAELKASA